MTPRGSGVRRESATYYCTLCGIPAVIWTQAFRRNFYCADCTSAHPRGVSQLLRWIEAEGWGGTYRAVDALDEIIEDLQP